MKTMTSIIALLAATACFGQTTRPRPATPAPGWKVAVDAADLKGKPRGDLKLSVPTKTRPELVIANRPSHFVAIADGALTSRQWSLLNVASGGVTPAFVSKSSLDEAVLSPDGAMLAGKSRGERGSGPGIEVWNMKTGVGVKRFAAEDKFRAPELIGFAADGNVLTMTAKNWKGQIQSWDPKTGAKAWEAEIEKNAEAKNIAMSPGGKLLAVVFEGNLVVLETAKGEKLASAAFPQPAEPATWGTKPLALTFSPDGLDLAMYGEHGHGKARLVIWDVASGNVMTDKVSDIAQDDRWAKRGETKLEFFGNTSFLRYSNQVLDRETGGVVWTIPPSATRGGDELIKVMGDDRVLMISLSDRRDKLEISAVQLPKDQIARAATAVASGGKAGDAALPPLAKADLANVRVLVDMAGPASLTPDTPAFKPAAGVAAFALRQQRANTGPQHDAKRAIFGVSMAAIAYHVTDKNEKTTLIERIQLGGGTAAGSFEFPALADLMDFTADGKMAVIRSGEDRIDVYSLLAGPAKHVIGFRPYEGDEKDKKIRFAAILPNDHIVTVNQQGRLIVWTIAGAKAVYEMATKSGDVVSAGGYTLSPGRKHIAFGNGSGVSIIDALTGQMLASMQHDKAGGDQLAFNPDGTRLAWFTSSPYPHLMALDLKTGAVIGDCVLPKESRTGPVVWAAPGHVLVGGYLADLEKRIAVWQYRLNAFGPKISAELHERVWASVMGTHAAPPVLVSAAIPHELAKRAIAAVRAEENIVIKPGMKVSVEVAVQGDGDFIKKVTDTLTAKVQKAGLIVEPGALIKLTATTAAGESKQETYRIIGRGAQETVTIPSYDCKLAWVKDGQNVWEVSTKGGGLQPHFTHLKEGETIQMYVDKMNANPGHAFYLGASVPGTVAKPLDRMNVSTFSTKGVVDQ